MAPSHPKGPSEIPHKVSICHNRKNSWRKGPAKGWVHPTRDREGLPLPVPLPRSSPGDSETRTGSKWAVGASAWPRGCPPTPAGQVPGAGWTPEDPGVPTAPPRALRAALGAAESGRRSRGKGHDGAPRDWRCGTQGGASPPPSSHPRAPGGYGRWPLGARRARGSATPEGAHPSPGSPNPGPGGGRRAGGTPAPRLLGTLCGGVLGAAAQMEKLRPEAGGATRLPFQSPARPSSAPKYSPGREWVARDSATPSGLRACGKVVREEPDT